MSFFMVFLLICVDLHRFAGAQHLSAAAEIGWWLRRTTKLPFRKLNSISSKQNGERGDHVGCGRLKH
jgi:hypothetical protein